MKKLLLLVTCIGLMHNTYTTNDSKKPLLSLNQKKALFALSAGGIMVGLLKSVDYFSKVKTPTLIIALLAINNASQAWLPVFSLKSFNNHKTEANNKPIDKALTKGLLAGQIMLCHSLSYERTLYRLGNPAFFAGYIATVLGGTTASYWSEKWFAINNTDSKNKQLLKVAASLSLTALTATLAGYGSAKAVNNLL